MFGFLKAKCNKSQADRVLELLQAHKGEAVALPMILDLRPRIAHYTAIIMELRDRGYEIECHSYWKDGIHCSEYTFKGISMKPRTIHSKGKSYTCDEIQEIMDKSYEEGYNAARIQFTTK